MELKESSHNETPRTVISNNGYWVNTNLGKHLDLFMGNTAYTWGYNDAELIKALTDAMSVSFVRGKQGESCELLDRVNKRLLDVTGMDSILWTVSGSDAVEAALEIAYQYHSIDNKYKILSFNPGYHGCTWLPKAMRNERKWSEHVVVASAPMWNVIEERESAENISWKDLLQHLNTHPDIGTIVIESLPWLAGIRPWSNDWLTNLRTLCNERNILLMIDDVAGGFGKLSPDVSHRYFGIEPDLISLGKGLTGGHVPLSCALAHKKISSVLNTRRWFHGHTWQPYVPGLGVVDKILDRIDHTHFNSIVSSFDAWEETLKADGLITGVRGAGLMRELLLTKQLAEKSLDIVGLVTNQLYENTLGVIVPLIADTEYWTELDSRVKNLLT